MSGHLRVWIEPGLAENWLPRPGDGYTVCLTPAWNGVPLAERQPQRAVVTSAEPGDGGLWVEMDVTGPYE